MQLLQKAEEEYDWEMKICGVEDMPAKQYEIRGYFVPMGHTGLDTKDISKVN